MLSGCSGSSSNASTPTPPAQQTTTPIIAPNGGAFTSAQTVTLTDTTPGATIYYSTTGPATTGSAMYTGAFTVSSTATVSAIAVASGYTQSSTASATFTINVPQTLSFSGNLSMDWGTASMPLTDLTASSSCPPNAVTVTIVTNDSNKTVGGGDMLASWTRDSTNATYGKINRGNTFSVNRYNTYTVTAACGQTTASTQLTITDPAPTITSLSSTLFKNSGLTVIEITGSGFVANDDTIGGMDYEHGTLVSAAIADCPTIQPTLLGGTGWVDDTHIIFSDQGTLNAGSWHLALVNEPNNGGNGGGWTCMKDAFGIIAPSNLLVASGLYITYVGAGGVYNSLDVYRNGTQVAFANMVGTGYPVATASAVYAPSPANGVAKIDLSTIGSGQTVGSLNTSYIPTPGYYPLMLAMDSNAVVYALAASGNSGTSPGELLRIDSGSATALAPANGFTSFTASGTHLLWTVPSGTGSNTTLHDYDVNAAQDTTISLSGVFDTLATLSGGTVLAFLGGSPTAQVIDPGTATNKGTVTFPTGILLSSNDLFALADGSIGSVSVTSGSSGNPTLTWSKQSTQSAQDLYRGFTLSSASGSSMLFYLNQSSTGTVSLQSRSYP